MAKEAKLAGVAEKAESDGSIFLFVNFDGLTHPVRIDPADVSKFLRRLQEVAFDQATQSKTPQSVLQLDAYEFEVARQGALVGLMVSTAQIGKIVLRFPHPFVDRLRAALDQIRTH
jgi:hypothetical protein